MKIILQDNSNFVLRFDRGEEAFSALMDFLSANKIYAATFSGIGACGELEVGDFDFDKKLYRKHTIAENLEILSLNGNAAISAGKPVLHVHGSFARADLTTLGGHVFKIVVSGTCEIFLTKLSGDMKRELNSDLNLNLLA